MCNISKDGSIKAYKVYRSTLGDILFLGDEFYEVELRSVVGELIYTAGESELPSDPIRLGECLGSFVPEFTRDESVGTYWHRKNVERWNQHTKPQLTQAIEDYYINGGKEKIANVY